MIRIDSTAGPELARLNVALGRIEGLGKRGAAELVRRAAADILLGSTGSGKGAGAFGGLASSYFQVAPEPGEATQEAESRNWRVLWKSTSFSRGLTKAKAVLGGDRSGVFSVTRGKGNRVMPPKRVFVRTRGKDRGSMFVAKGKRMPKTAVTVRGRTPGYSVLNLQALATTYAIVYRDSARGAAASQFVTKKYRKALTRRDPAKTGGSDTVAIPLSNYKGRKIGGLELNLKPGTAYGRILGEMGVPERFAGIVGDVVRAVAVDREAYLLHAAMKQEIRK